MQGLRCLYKVRNIFTMLIVYVKQLNLKSSKTILLGSLILITYFLLLLIFSPTTILTLDSYYYWEWSRHLALSYFDGPPMIAYLIKISTLLFGDTLFALGIVGITITALTSLVIYKTARVFLQQEASFIAMLLWLFSPDVSLDLLKQTTYDLPLTLFWALTVYSAIKYINYNKIRDLYFTAVYIGLMLLSKYSGIVLVLGILIFLLTSRYRFLFKTYHLYLSMLLTVIIFSPVIIWNSQHDWQSFVYQLEVHKIPASINRIGSICKYFFIAFVPALNFFLLVPLWCWYRVFGPTAFSYPPYPNTPPQGGEGICFNHLDNRTTQEGLRTKLQKLLTKAQTSLMAKTKTALPPPQTTLILYFCIIICLTFFCFYLYLASKARIRDDWLLQFIITAALLAGYCFEKFKFRKVIFSILGLSIIICFCIAINSNYNFYPSKKLDYYNSIKNFNLAYPNIKEPIITCAWIEARILFFLKDKPNIYTINCGAGQNQYTFWSKKITEKIKNKTIKQIIYIDITNRISVVAKLFDECVSLNFKGNNNSMVFYRCSVNVLSPPRNLDGVVPEFSTT